MTHSVFCGVRLAIAVVALTITSGVHAADVPITGDKAVEVHGFVSPGFIVTTGNNYLAKSKRGSFEFTEVGLNFTVPITDKLRSGVQLFARDLGTTGNYSPKADWFYLDYRFDDWFGIRAGRVKIPFGLYNDTVDIDAARVPILLPQSIYSITSRDFLLAQTGGEVYGRVRTKSLGALEYRIYGGTIFLETQSAVAIQVNEIDIPYVVGQRLMWETPLEGLRVGGSLQALKLDLAVTLPKIGPLAASIPATLWVGSAEYALHDWLFAAEYSRWITRLDSSDHTVIPAARAISERGYVMTSYRLTNWLHPGAYYSVLYPNVDDRSGKEAMQHDIAGTFRFDINRNWLVKVEGHFMSGTAGLSAQLNDNKPPSLLERNWAAFLLKTTAHF
jgi:hypothetical protein